MTRAAAMTAASALCLLWTAGCASTGATKSQAAAQPPADAADSMPAEMPNANADIATLTKNHPGTIDGELKRAQLLRAKGDYDEAARSLAQIMLIAPDDGRVVGEYGKVLEQQGHSREALPFLKRAAQLSPTEWSLQSALGVAYDQLDDHANARTAYDRALALKPAEASVLNNYAVSRMLAGDYAGAQRLFAKAQANGASNSKIAGNLEKLAALNPPPAPQSVTAQSSAKAATLQQPSTALSPVAPKPGITATTLAQVQHPASPSAAKPNPPVAGARMAVTATKVAGGQVVMQHVPADRLAGGARVAVAAPKALGGQVVMQRVPVDPLAGPVHTVATKTASVAHKSLAVAKKAAPETPSLRTAADTN
jgi:Flp pilus assembly protein TadD